MINYHIHTNVSIDASGTMEDYCKVAAEQGFKYICFTNHMEIDDIAVGILDYVQSNETLEKTHNDVLRLRDEYDLDIGFGVELGYTEKYEDEIRDFSKKWPFDFVLGTVHKVFGHEVSDYGPAQKTFSKYGLETVYKEYFRVLKNAINSGIFDSIGHFDVVRKYSAPVDFSVYGKDAIECVKSIAKQGIALEANTNGFIWVGDNFPSENIFKSAFDMGIRKLTIGSDCHEPKFFDLGLDRGFRVLKLVGFKQVCVFKDRKARFVDIP